MSQKYACIRVPIHPGSLRCTHSAGPTNPPRSRALASHAPRRLISQAYFLRHGTSASRRKFISGLDGERSATVGPLEWLRHRLVEVFDEGPDAVAEMVYGHETGTPKETSDQDAEPQLDLVESGGSFGCVDETNPVRRIDQEVHAGGHGSKDPAATLDAHVELEIADVGNKAHQGL